MATLYRTLPSWGVPSRCAYTVRDSNGQQSPLPRLLIKVSSKMPGSGAWKRTASLVVLGVGGLASYLVGLSWGTVLHAFATYVDRVENAYDLINPDHISLVHSIVSSIVGLGHFLLVFGVVALLVGLLGAAYTAVQSMSPLGHKTNGLRRAFLVVSGMMVLATTAIAMWTTRACFQSYREFGTRRLSDSHTTDDEGAATTQTPPLPQWSRHCLEAAWPFPQRYEHGARPPVRTLQG